MQPGWAAHRILGEAARAGFRPRSASCGGCRNARSSLAQPGWATPQPLPLSSPGLGTVADFSAVVLDMMSLEPESHQKDPWDEPSPPKPGFKLCDSVTY